VIFQVLSDDVKEADGWYVDDVVISDDSVTAATTAVLYRLYSPVTLEHIQRPRPDSTTTRKGIGDWPSLAPPEARDYSRVSLAEAGLLRGLSLKKGGA